MKPVTGRSGLLPTASSLRIQPVTYLAAFGSARAALAKAEENLSAAHGGRAPQAAGGQASREPARRRDATTTLAQGEADMAANKATLEADRISLDYTRITSHSRAASAAPRSRRARLSRSRGPARSHRAVTRPDLCRCDAIERLAPRVGRGRLCAPCDGQAQCTRLAWLRAAVQEAAVAGAAGSRARQRSSPNVERAARSCAAPVSRVVDALPSKAARSC